MTTGVTKVAAAAVSAVVLSFDLITVPSQHRLTICILPSWTSISQGPEIRHAVIQSC